jgi:hypothetical protein
VGDFARRDTAGHERIVRHDALDLVSIIAAGDDDAELCE